MVKSNVSFCTRCSPQRFLALNELIGMSAKWMEQAKSLGFGHLLSLQSLKLPRDLLAVILLGYDPPTQELRIGGEEDICDRCKRSPSIALLWERGKLRYTRG